VLHIKLYSLILCIVQNEAYIPTTSPTPINIPDKPTSCFALEPICFVKPMLGLYTPLKNDNSMPIETEIKNQLHIGIILTT
jgi:hypothetical protein